MSNPIESLVESLDTKPKPLKLLFLGTGKNVGKTTALNYFNDCLHRVQRSSVLLSTGYDGEDLDFLTGFPKPRVRVFAGDFFVTCRQVCLPVESHITILKQWDISTVLGPVVLAQARKTVAVALASVGSTHSLRRVCEDLTRLLPRALQLVDGSINRRSFLDIARAGDKVVLSTGSSYSQDVGQQLKQLRYFQILFSLPPLLGSAARIQYFEALDSANFNSIRNRRVCVSGVSRILLDCSQYDHFVRSGNQLFLQTPAPELVCITYNPLNGATNQLVTADHLSELRSRVKNIPVVDIHQLRHAPS